MLVKHLYKILCGMACKKLKNKKNDDGNSDLVYNTSQYLSGQTIVNLKDVG